MIKGNATTGIWPRSRVNSHVQPNVLHPELNIKTGPEAPGHPGALGLDADPQALLDEIRAHALGRHEAQALGKCQDCQEPQSPERRNVSDMGPSTWS